MWRKLSSLTWLMDDRIRGKRIMVVDDEHDLTLFYQMCLEY
jgi:hypothetical protein